MSAIDLDPWRASEAGPRRTTPTVLPALAELGVVSADLAGRLQRMAGFRNLLVHLYAEVGDRRVYEILRADVADLDELRSQVLDWLNEHG